MGWSNCTPALCMIAGFRILVKKVSLGSDKAQVAPGTHCAIFLIKPRLTWRPHRTASPRRSSAAPGVLAPSSECLPETLDALPWEGIANLICKACCQCVIQSVVCHDCKPYLRKACCRTGCRWGLSRQPEVHTVTVDNEATDKVIHKTSMKETIQNRQKIYHENKETN